MLVVVYLIVSMFLTASILGVLKRNIAGVFVSIDLNLSIGIGFILSAFWTYLTRNDNYRNSSGQRVKMDTRNEFFFISMEKWSYLFFIAGFVFLFYGCQELTY
ncbi:hypothetical protein [uncultured Cyclobacterium sp.]|uniref:hypothetical protein n=1 Tax=uncultured Cyclobacterium sp. TaxID=453820 RepID=UPI0030EB330E